VADRREVVVKAVEVELADLRGWADQVGRASSDMGAAHGYATGNIADADFGRILELITGDYAAMIPKFHQVLAEDESRLGKTRDALGSVAQAYRAADERSNGRFAALPGGGTATTAAPPPPHWCRRATRGPLCPTRPRSPSDSSSTRSATW
jgi:hypothetical protein